MRLLVILGLIVVFSCNTATKTQAPKAVKKTFQAKYPGENDPDWHQDANNNYEANFKIDGIKYRADFKENGTWIETETSLKKKELPKPIKNAIKDNYGSEDITEIEKVESATKGLFYDVEFKQKGKNKDVEFRKNGSIIG